MTRVGPLTAVAVLAAVLALLPGLGCRKHPTASAEATRKAGGAHGTDASRGGAADSGGVGSPSAAAGGATRTGAAVLAKGKHAAAGDAGGDGADDVEDVQADPAAAFAAATSVKEVTALLGSEDDLGPAEARLRELVKEKGEALLPELRHVLNGASPELSVLAAKALAAIGTPAAMKELLQAFAAQPGDSDLRRDLGAAAAEVADPACGPFLLETVMSAKDDDLRDIAQRALAHVADDQVLAEIVGQYDTAASEATRQLLADTVRYLEDPALVETLAALADATGNRVADDPLVAAARDTLGIIGTADAAKALLRELSAPENENAAGPLTAAIGRIRNLDAEPVLLKAAQDVAGSAAARLAAIAALGNYTTAEADRALRVLAASQDAKIKAAAVTALARRAH